MSRAKQLPFEREAREILLHCMALVGLEEQDVPADAMDFARSQLEAVWVDAWEQGRACGREDGRYA